jgi:hypothetical protein
MRGGRGNIWDKGRGVDALVITTNGYVKKNGAAVMGRGIARQALQRFPGIDQWLGWHIEQFGNKVFVLNNDLWAPGHGHLVSFPVKHNWWESASLDLIEDSAHQLAKLRVDFGWKQVFMPRPGCGNGNLEWEEVREVLRPILDNHFTLFTW